MLDLFSSAVIKELKSLRKQNHSTQKFNKKLSNMELTTAAVVIGLVLVASFQQSMKIDMFFLVLIKIDRIIEINYE